ncbi:class I SAM-dependent methyltransferase [Ramlibacter sp. PS4R-6]|uniref:class I SAM-dependent methyltransferase n=1 Tax=Ramlibacter sp. PS4R-6 TaxID=3133438 RepID=UPI0030B29B55
MDCRVCDSNDLEPVLDLGEQPWCNHFLKPEEAGHEPYYPLRVLRCRSCATAQLDYTVRKEVMFGDHTYLSGVTKSLSAHFRSVAEEVDRRFGAGRSDKAVLDIGSNDGTQLKHFQALGWDVLGVESSAGTARRANEAGVKTVNAFFNLPTLRSLGRRFDAINAAGVFFHLEELHSVTDAIREGLKDDGVFVVQFLYMKTIMENLAFDQVYHEHLLYYTLETIEVLLQRHGLSMFDAWLAPIHGGSIIGFVSHKGTRATSERLQELRRRESESGCNTAAAYHRFAQQVQEVKARDLAYLRAARAQGKRVFGFGAPVKGNTLLNFFGIGPDLIECLVEKNELRRGLVSPGMHIPLRMESDIDVPPDIYYVLAWNFKQEILANNRELLERGVEFYFPVDPQP